VVLIFPIITNMKSFTSERVILSRPGDWSFDYHVSKIFDEHVRKSIPCYDEIQKLIAEISQNFLPEEAIVYDLGTATGEVLCNIHKANEAKKIFYFGIDVSPHMLKKAEEKCIGIENVTFYKDRIESFNYLLSDLIVSAFTIQFVDVKLRKEIFRRVKKSLKPTGIFVLCEKMIFENSANNALFKRIHEDWKLNHFTRKEVELKRNSLKNVMKLITLSEYYRMLWEVGFRQIDVFFQWCNFVCILAK